MFRPARKFYFGTERKLLNKFLNSILYRNMKNRDYDNCVYEEYNNTEEELDIEDFRKKIRKEAIKELLDNSRNYRGRKDKVHLKLRTSDLCNLFNIKKRTLYNWIKTNQLDPTNINCIIQLYNKLNS